MKKYNDYELLYLWSWHSEEALTILLNKYQNYIRIKLYHFKIQKHHFEDFEQEGMMTLMKAIARYNINMDVSFFTYFNVLLCRRIMRLLEEDTRRCEKILLSDFLGEYADKGDLEESVYQAIFLEKIQKMQLDPLKKAIFNEIMLGNKKAKEFAEEHLMKSKDVYNQIYLLRKKVQELL